MPLADAAIFHVTMFRRFSPCAMLHARFSIVLPCLLPPLLRFAAAAAALIYALPMMLSGDCLLILIHTPAP